MGRKKLKPKNEKFEKMLEANQLTHKILQNCEKLIRNSDKPISTSEVAKYAQFSLTRASVESAFKGLYGFPNVICISVNDAIIHGLPSEDVFINKGDIVSLDFGVKIDGYCSDAAITFLNQDPLLLKNWIKTDKKMLVRDTRMALSEAILALTQAFPDCTVSNITKQIDKYKDKYGIVDSFGGHEIGRNVHEGDLFIPNTLTALEKDVLLEIGQVITIEPMFTLGSSENYVDRDGYTIKTKDGSLAAHCEYSIAITENGVVVLK